MIRTRARGHAAAALAASLLPVLAVAAPLEAGHARRATADSSARSPRHGAVMPGMSGSGSMAGMDMGAMPMSGFLGPYPMSREASGTSWQPEAEPHPGVHLRRGAWMIMVHAAADLALDGQGGPRGDTKLFGDDLGMAMAQRSLGPGTLGLRAMLSLEPATIGKSGYPLLLQTGETSDGVTPLVDRQHPHDLFMELAGAYSVARGDRSLFVYGGLPGEPALGPPAFLHRFSAQNDPLAPITHHWLDSTHITYGVLTGGAVAGRVKLEASAFRGREPDQNRWDIETPRLDSHSFRLSVNPTDRWALQASWGRLHSPEQLEPDVDQERITASALVDGLCGDTGRWEAMVAWGRDRNRPGHALDAFTAEAALAFAGRHTFFARGERVRKDELFAPPDPRAGEALNVGEVTAGYRWDFLRRNHWTVGAGGAGALAFVPPAARGAYGGSTPASGEVFLHGSLR